MAKKKTQASIGKKLLLKGFLGCIAIAFLSVFTLILLVRKNVFGTLPTAEQLAALKNEEATLVLSSNGAIIGKIFAKDRTNVRYTDLPKYLADALVSTEDQRFFEHEGVDAWSYVRVLLRTIIARDKSGGGGSTISQQLIKNLYGRERHGFLTVPVDKIKEALVAQRLEQVYSKEDVLTLYFNSVPFGENLYGVEAASQRYFSKPVSKLRIEEAAVLVGMLKANTGYNPRLHPQAAKGRRDQVLTLMASNGKITLQARDSLQALPLTVHYSGLDVLDAYGYFTAQVEQQSRAILANINKKTGKTYDIEKDGLRIHTTLDTALQQAALRAVRKQMLAMQPKLDRELRTRHVRTAWEREMAKHADRTWKRNEKAVRDVFTWDAATADTISYRDSLWHYQSMLNAAFLMVEPGTGKVRAYSGGNDFRSLPFDQTQSHRPIASTIKPVLYAAGLRRGLEPCTYLNNVRKVYPEYDRWSPENFEQDSIGGEVALWYALAHSMNIPTVDLYFRTGADTIRDTFKALRLPTDGVDNPALALGAADISLQEIVRAYSAFANDGLVRDPQFIERITDAKGKVIYQGKMALAARALDENVAETITAMLRGAVDHGTGASIRSRFGIHSALAGKTGTSQDFSDAWFMAYTPGLVMGTWVGARDPSVHFVSGLGTGAQLALPIIGGTLAEMERSSAMRKHYLLPFPPEDDIDMSCDPRRFPSVIDKIFEGLLDPSKRTSHQGKEMDRKDEKEGFFRRLFPKKD